MYHRFLCRYFLPWKIHETCRLRHFAFAGFEFSWALKPRGMNIQERISIELIQEESHQTGIEENWHPGTCGMFSFFPLDPRAFTSQRANHERFFHHDQFSWPFTFSHLKILFRMKLPRREVWFEVTFFAWTNANQLLFVSWSILLHVPTLKYDPGVRGIGECDLSHCGGCTRRSTISCFRSFGCMTGMAHKRHRIRDEFNKFLWSRRATGGIYSPAARGFRGRNFWACWRSDGEGWMYEHWFWVFTGPGKVRYFCSICFKDP